MSQCKIHNVGFYNPEPRAVYCMALQAEEKKIAVSRSDASIEIWNLSNALFIERTITSTPENFNIEGLSWCNNRLFSVGLHGLLIEYDLQTLALKNRTVLTGEAAYCLDINSNKTLIAVGTEQGYVNIFEIEEDGVVFKKFLDKQEGRIICLKFDPTGEYIASGSIDAIRIWNVKSGHAIHKLTTGRSEAQKPTIVWCLEITNDFTIITGDSRGKLTFWDGKIGSQIESYQSHRADILSICLSEDQNSLYCAGVDPTITNYARIQVKGGTQKYVKSIQRKIHEHDVRALVVYNNKLYSSGADGYLACSFHPPKTLIKHAGFLQNAPVGISSEQRLVMLRYPHHVELWSLGVSDSVQVTYRGLLSLKTEPKKLLLWQRTVEDDEGQEQVEGIVCSCLSDDGKWLFVSTGSGIRLFQIDYEDNKFKLLKVDSLDDKDTTSVQATFSNDSKQLITAPSSGGLHIYNLNISKGDVSMVQRIQFKKEITDVVTLLTVSPCGKFLIAADPQSNIAVWTQKKRLWVDYCKLPKYEVPPTALAVHPKTVNLVVAYSDNKIIEYDLMNRQLSDFSKRFPTVSKSYPIKNITFDPRLNDIVLFHDDNSIIIVDKRKVDQNLKAKVPKIKAGQTLGENNVEKSALFTVKKYKHLVHIGWLKDDEIVVVEVNPLTIMEQLPPAFVQNTFGLK